MGVVVGIAKGYESLSVHPLVEEREDAVNVRGIRSYCLIPLCCSDLGYLAETRLLSPWLPQKDKGVDRRDYCEDLVSNVAK